MSCNNQPARLGVPFSDVRLRSEDWIKRFNPTTACCGYRKRTFANIDASILYIDDLNAVTKMANNSSGINSIEDVKESHEEIERVQLASFQCNEKYFLCV